MLIQFYVRSIIGCTHLYFEGQAGDHTDRSVDCAHPNCCSGTRVLRCVCAVGVLVPPLRPVGQPLRTMGHWVHWIDIGRFFEYVTYSLVLAI